MKKIMVKLVLISFFLSINSFAVRILGVDVNEEEFPQQKKEYWLFVGNPGAGKSTFINSLLGEYKTPSGVNAGNGLTSHCKSYKHGNITYLDTPGLADVSMRAQAAHEIQKGLSKDDIYKIFFVVSLEEARVKDQDITSINLIMDAVDLENKEFNIIINKLAPKDKKILADPLKVSEVRNKLNAGKYKTENIIFVDLDMDMFLDDEIKFISIDKKLNDFFYHNSASMHIPKESVKEIEHRNFDKMKEEFTATLNELEKKIEVTDAEQIKLKQELINQQKDLQEAEQSIKKAKQAADESDRLRKTEEAARKKAENNAEESERRRREAEYGSRSQTNGTKLSQIVNVSGWVTLSPILLATGAVLESYNL